MSSGLRGSVWCNNAIVSGGQETVSGGDSGSRERDRALPETLHWRWYSARWYSSARWCLEGGYSVQPVSTLCLLARAGAIFQSNFWGSAVCNQCMRMLVPYHLSSQSYFPATGNFWLIRLSSNLPARVEDCQQAACWEARSGCSDPALAPSGQSAGQMSPRQSESSDSLSWTTLLGGWAQRWSRSRWPAGGCSCRPWSVPADWPDCDARLPFDIATWMSLWRLGGKAVRPWLEQSAVILPDIHRHRHRAGQEERKSHLGRRLKPWTPPLTWLSSPRRAGGGCGWRGWCGPPPPSWLRFADSELRHFCPAGCSPRDGPSATTGESRWH